MSHVFISYARVDDQQARALANALRQSRIPVWWDEDVMLGERWQPAIEDAVLDAAAVVVLWSRNSIRSEWVHQEATIAIEQRTLVPVLIHSIVPPGEFGQYDCANLSNWDPRRPHREFDQLRRHLLDLFDRPGTWQAERLDQETILVTLDVEEHTVRYSRGHLYVDGEIRVEGAPSVIDQRSFNFELADGNEFYPARLDVWVTLFRGNVKRLALSVGGNALYDG